MFIEFYKNDFETAKLNENLPIVQKSLCYGGFIQMLPNEKFSIITNGTTDINFVGGIQVDLINGCGSIVQNIDDNFYYIGAVDTKGVYQIFFEFGYLGIDFGSEILYLKITDITNDNVFFSSPFLITNINKEKSTKIRFSSNRIINNTDYIIFPYEQSIRFSDCFETNSPNKSQENIATTSNGMQISFRRITTFLDKFLYEGFNKFIQNRFEKLIAHPIIYVNGYGCNITEFKVDERAGMSNLLKGEFLVNKTSGYVEEKNYLFEDLEVIEFLPLNGGTYTISEINSLIPYLKFNKNIFSSSLPPLKLYKDGIFVQDMAITILDTYINFSLPILTIGMYSITFPPNVIYNEDLFWAGLTYGNYTFTVENGNYSNSDYDTNDYYTN